MRQTLSLSPPLWCGIVDFPRQASTISIYFYTKSATNTLVASSVSTVDNVEHLFLPSLSAGRYDLQVLKRSGAGSENYALAFEAFAVSLNIEKIGTNVVVSWPLAPTGFRLQFTTNLVPPISWSTVTNVVATNENRATISPTMTAQFFSINSALIRTFLFASVVNHSIFART